MRKPSTRRPLVSRWAFGAWLVLLAMLPGGLLSYYRNSRIGIGTWDPGGMMGINYQTFHYAAERARQGLEFYDVAPPGTYDWAVYLYPPITVVSYVPFTLVEWTTGYAILTGLSVLAALGATAVICRYVETLGVQLGWVDLALVFAVFVLSTHAYGTIYFGNINLFLALAIVVGFWALLEGRSSLSGAVFALAALFKLFPALLGLWLLRRKQYRAVGVAIVTGLGGILLGAILFGLGTTWYYFTAVLPDRTDTSTFVGGYPVDGTYYITVQQPLSHLVSSVWPTAPYEVILGVSILFCLGVLALFYVDVHTELDRQMAIFATLAVTVSLIPSLRWYLVLLFLPIVSVLYLWEEGYARIPFVAGGLLFSLTISAGDAVAYLDAGPEWVATVAYPVAGAANPPLYGIGLMLGACLWHRYRTIERRREATVAAPTPQEKRVTLE